MVHPSEINDFEIRENGTPTTRYELHYFHEQGMMLALARLDKAKGCDWFPSILGNRRPLHDTTRTPGPVSPVVVVPSK
jgi:hypothetical protein